MNYIKVWGLRRKWRSAQDVHAMEHETIQPLSLSCAAVGHYALIDSYSDFFDKDARRKFLMEYREMGV